MIAENTDFMGKPNNDASQENLLNRLERLIFQISMVANISDENFGAASGVSLKYKLLFGHPSSKVPADSWVLLRYAFTPNIPSNLLEEAQIAAQLSGIVSQATQLEVISAVDNVQAEIDRIEEEQNKAPAAQLINQMLSYDAETGNMTGATDGEEQ